MNDISDISQVESQLLGSPSSCGCGSPLYGGLSKISSSYVQILCILSGAHFPQFAVNDDHFLEQ